jgi:hypothetical protein
MRTLKTTRITAEIPNTAIWKCLTLFLNDKYLDLVFSSIFLIKSSSKTIIGSSAIFPPNIYFPHTLTSRRYNDRNIKIGVPVAQDPETALSGR